MSDELSKNPIVKPEEPGRFKMSLKKDRMAIEIVAGKGWDFSKHGTQAFNFDIPIENKQSVIDIFRNFVAYLERAQTE